MFELFGFTLTAIDLILLLGSATLVGMAKTGVPGAGMVAVPLLAIAFGGKESTGLLLTMLIFADVFGVSYYHRHANWQHLIRLLPFALFGVIIGTIFGHLIDDEAFRLTMAVIIFFSLAQMIWQERQEQVSLLESGWFVAIIGILGGFTTMVGNLAGPVMSLYLLAMRFPKNEFIGTAAWFFLCINLFKVPFHIWVWNTVSWQSTALTATLIPLIAVGAAIGIWLVGKINEHWFRRFVIAMTAVAAAAMLF
jgi:uncharacterized membrane protein YfcA